MKTILILLVLSISNANASFIEKIAQLEKDIASNDKTIICKALENEIIYAFNRKQEKILALGEKKEYIPDIKVFFIAFLNRTKKVLYALDDYQTWQGIQKHYEKQAKDNKCGGEK